MNTRDPFNLRQKSPLSYIQSGARAAVASANNFGDQLSRSVQRMAQPDHSGGGAPSDHNVAGSSSDYVNGDDPRARQRSTSLHANALGDKISNMVSSGSAGQELPMYKDKPYNYDRSRRRLPIFRKNRLLLLVLGFVSVLAYFGFAHRRTLVETATEATEKTKANMIGNVWKSEPKEPGQQINWDARRSRVRDVFRTSWQAYEEHAWGFDQFHPLSKKGTQMVPNGMGWIIVDALDTMMIMNLTKELSHAKEWVSTSLSYDKDHDVNTFETTIRMLGGLLSAHYLQSLLPKPEVAEDEEAPATKDDDMFLEKATDLAERLLGAYESKSGVPYASINLHTQKGIPSHDDDGASSTSEAGTLQLEMKYLAKLTGEKNYWDTAERVMKIIDNNGARDGLVPIFIYADTGHFRGENVRLGSRGDSYYEYLIKQYLQTSNQEPIYLDMWKQAMRGVKKHLITYTKHANLTILGERPDGLDKPVFPKMDHLVCFMPGTMALAATGGIPLEEARRRPGWGKEQEEDMKLARELTTTCWGMYLATATGLSPEIAHFDIHDPPIMLDQAPDEPLTTLDDLKSTDWHMDYKIHIADFHNLQRPETVESLFYMWRVTGDEKYREWGWQMFEAFMEHTAVKNGGGFTSLDHVDKVPAPMRDNMESFWMAETLKYFYLLFSPNDLLPLDQVVFNTEAHPMPKFELGKLFSTGWSRLPRDADGNLIKKES
ncbi:hypothetical protein FH972_021440 [Carpinus fangiana]|uniref:alpha-1,2-Mannosidase n=1 Tax=Carpinus fangiana TaxID=176857 RepID=A0A5N6KPP5_9ROSI|nr:hypothetical protein FH972_021440 [Carpinus fangiana]